MFYQESQDGAHGRSRGNKTCRRRKCFEKNYQACGPGDDGHDIEFPLFTNGMV